MAGSAILQESYGYASPRTVDVSTGLTGPTATVDVTTNPVTTDTVYFSTNGTGAVTTYYNSVSWSSTNPLQVQEEDITQDYQGPDARTTVDIFNAGGQLVWSKDPDGYITYYQYDSVTGGISEVIPDANLNEASQSRRPI